jgi:hypothetical protein
VVESLPIKGEALNSNPNTIKKKILYLLGMAVKIGRLRFQASTGKS